MSSSLVFRALPCLALLLAACAAEPPPIDLPVESGVVVGVRSELRAGVDIDRLRATLTVNGEAHGLDDRRTTSTPPLRFPEELRLDGLEDGDEVGVVLDAFAPGSSTTPLLTRLAETRVVGGHMLLLPVTLESRCVALLGGSGGGPICPEGQTCIAGACADPFTSPATLRDYAPDWADAGDVCKAKGAGAPIVTVGGGQSDYLSVSDGDEMQVEAGPQGGHHVWVAVRMKNLRQSGSITTITGHVPDLDLDIPAFSVIFTFDQDEGGYCELYGLRYQLDAGGADIETLLGKTVDLTVRVKDKDGAEGVGTKTVRLSDTFI